MDPTSFSDFVARWIDHRRFMDNAHATWEMLHGTPCGPYDPRRAGRPMGIIEVPRPGSIALTLRDGDDPRFS